MKTPTLKTPSYFKFKEAGSLILVQGACSVCYKVCGEVPANFRTPLKFVYKVLSNLRKLRVCGNLAANFYICLPKGRC